MNPSIEPPDSAPAITPQKISYFVLEESVPRLVHLRLQAVGSKMSRFGRRQFESVLGDFEVQSLLFLDATKWHRPGSVEVLLGFGF
jgi:hypothetical protein